MSVFEFPTRPWPSNGTDYGHDLSVFVREVSLSLADGSTYSATTFDASHDMAEVDGRLCLAESLARRLVTFPGTLIDDPDYGIDIRQYLNDDVNDRDLALISSAVVTELKKDERVIQVQASAQLVAGVLAIAISVQDQKGPFKLTMTADQVNVSVLLSGVTGRAA